MAFDAVAVSALTQELQNTIIDGRIDKVYQPERDEIILSIRTFTGAFKLLVSASPANARAHLTQYSKENPKVPPMFCMLLRKHLQSGKIISVAQPGFERVLKITILGYNDLGDQVEKHLIAELMGRNSNIILTDNDGRIIDSARHIDFTQSSVRQILPGLQYQSPPPQDKAPILDPSSPISLDFSFAAQNADKAVMAAVSGISPITAREIIQKVTGRADTKCAELPPHLQAAIAAALDEYRGEILSGKFSPVVIKEAQSGRLIDFSASEVRQYGSAAACISFGSMSEAVEAFYHERDNRERMKQKSADLLRIIHTNLERLSKKLIIQQQTLRDAENKEEYKMYGDLLTAGIYLIKQGESEVTMPNYFAEGSPQIRIPISPMLTPAQNAQRYYKKYTKAKTAEIEVTKQLQTTEREIEYLESALALAENCLCTEDINAIRAELAEEGYLKRRTEQKRRKQEISKPHHFISSDGFDIYVGKNNLQNDTLTLRFANTSDIWFHTKKIHGSHTVIKLGINKDVPKSTMLEAAQLAAYFSKARASNQVPVDYTGIKNVRKPNGAKPGMVIYDNYNTVYVTPKSPEDLGLSDAGK